MESHFWFLGVEMKAWVVAWWSSGLKTLAMKDAECGSRDGMPLRSYLRDPDISRQSLLLRGLCNSAPFVSRWDSCGARDHIYCYFAERYTNEGCGGGFSRSLMEALCKPHFRCGRKLIDFYWAFCQQPPWL